MPHESKISERDRKARLTTIINLLNQAIQIAIGILSVPLTLKYLGVDLFSIWMALVAMLTLIAYSDLGIGIGLQNRLTQAISSNNKLQARKTVVNAASFAFIVLTTLLAFSIVAVPMIDWGSYFKTSASISAALIERAALIIVITVMLGIVANILQRIVISFQEGFVVAGIQCVSRVLVLVTMYLVVYVDGGFLLLIFVIQGAGHIIQIFLTFIYILLKKSWVLRYPEIGSNYLDKDCMKEIVKIGGLGLGASIAYFVASNSIPVALTNIFGSSSIVDYMIVIKITSIPILVATHMYSPLWPAVTDALIKGDLNWIKRSMIKNAIVLLGITCASSVLVSVYADDVIHLWIGDKNINPSDELIFACVIMMSLLMWNAYISTYLNGLGKFKSQATAGLLIALTFFAFANILGSELTVVQVIWVIVVGFLLRCLYLQLELVLTLKATISRAV